MKYFRISTTPAVAPAPPEVKAAVKKVKQLDGYVGFANLPNQVYRKAVKKGFEFTLMVVGESGLGKSTLINSMFLTDIYSNEYPGPSQRLKKTVAIDTQKVLLKEKGVNLTLTVVDTPGNSNCTNCAMSLFEFRKSPISSITKRKLLNSDSTQKRSKLKLCFIGAVKVSFYKKTKYISD